MKKWLIRDALPTDAPCLTHIYNYFVKNSSSTLQEKSLTIEEMRYQIKQLINAQHPFLVAENQLHQVEGYCYAAPMRSRCGYRYAFEESIYINHKITGQNLGPQLMQALFTQLEKTEAQKLLAVISLPNPTSIQFHEKLGFTPCGILPAVGWKFNRWFDVGYWIKDLEKSPPQSD